MGSDTQRTYGPDKLSAEEARTIVESWKPKPVLLHEFVPKTPQMAEKIEYLKRKMQASNQRMMAQGEGFNAPIMVAGTTLYRKELVKYLLDSSYVNPDPKVQAGLEYAATRYEYTMREFASLTLNWNMYFDNKNRVVVMGEGMLESLSKESALVVGLHEAGHSEMQISPEDKKQLGLFHAWRIEECMADAYARVASPFTPEQTAMYMKEFLYKVGKPPNDPEFDALRYELRKKTEQISVSHIKQESGIVDANPSSHPDTDNRLHMIAEGIPKGVALRDLAFTDQCHVTVPIATKGEVNYAGESLKNQR